MDLKKYLWKCFLPFSLWILFFCCVNVSAEEIIDLDMGNVHWNETEFIYDNTLKQVYLVNVPEPITVKYSENEKIQAGTYTARALLDYDDSKYKLINYDYTRIQYHVWEIKIGNVPTFNFIGKTILEDGRYHSLDIPDLPSGVTAHFSDNNYQRDPGKYTITATFDVPAYYHPVQPKTAVLTILSKKIQSETDDVTIISESIGFDPDLKLTCNWKTDISEYENLDLTSVGSYREVKMAFSLNMTLYEQSALLEHIAVVRVKIPEELSQSKDLLVYDYGNHMLTDLNSNQTDDELVFVAESLSSQYLIIGIRDTYTSNPIWKVWIIAILVVLFVIGFVVIIVMHKKRRSFR